MSLNAEKSQENIKWGIRMAVSSCARDSDAKVYKSFAYDGVQYSLFDSVYMYREGAKETDIGKLVKLWESKKGRKKGKVVWFFRPIDVCHYLSDYNPSWNELFLASGQEKGVSNIIPLEAIVGKCNVVCTSKDRRNVLPPGSVLGKANYYFSHTFNVEELRILDKFPDFIDSIKVERLFNSNLDNFKAPLECRSGLSAGTRVKDVPTRVAEKSKVPVEGRTGLNASARVKDEPIHSAESAENTGLETPSTSDYFEYHTSRSEQQKKRKILVASEADSLSTGQDSRKWFSKLPWEERMKEAHEYGTLVQLVNLDPSYTSSEVEDIISIAFKRKADAKIVLQVPFTNSSYGQALVIFKSKVDADFVMLELKKKCLIVGEGRPLIARKSSLNEPGTACNFPGHITLDKSAKLKSEKRKVAYTSHCAQANTIEHEMAMQWRILQNRSDICWEALHEDQAKEISNYLKLMMKISQSGKDKGAETVNASIAPIEEAPNESK